MLGYKALEKDMSNRYGFVYEVGKTYLLNGELKWSQNGFHFCERPEDTLRYVDGFNNEIVFVEVEGFGKVVTYEDEYYGYYDMHASSEMRIIREVSREEIFDMIINSYDDRVKRYASSIKLTDYEKEVILERYPHLESTINYYQRKEFMRTRK